MTEKTTIICQNCDAKLSIPSSKSGKTLRCPKCKSLVEASDRLVGSVKKRSAGPIRPGQRDDEFRDLRVRPPNTEPDPGDWPRSDGDEELFD